ncbi:hypothetical protein HMPREF3192_01424 [Atopobium deltae]|uniref:Uncharacterized protein n=1 Tax=Atopobium deltae TaxID=1393034 RepID=A0A133XQ49_9ACTN|nr:hypothetical protein HMPREF3192_01424 [Atopobium deltae]
MNRGYARMRGVLTLELKRCIVPDCANFGDGAASSFEVRI